MGSYKMRFVEASRALRRISHPEKTSADRLVYDKPQARRAKSVTDGGNISQNPTGQMDLEKKPSLSNLQSEIQKNTEILAALFGNFPRHLLDIIYVSENGQAKQVAITMMCHGWKPPKRIRYLIDMLSTSEDPHIATKYYHGEYSSDLAAKFTKLAPGSFCTMSTKVEDKFEYRILYTNSDRKPDV